MHKGERMRVALIHVRDPQFYAVPNQARAENGDPQIMGFPPIGIMSLSSVLKANGHECLMFDQANPDTPNSHILDKVGEYQPDLVGLSFLSTTSYPYAKMLSREMRERFPNQRQAFGGVFVSLNADLVKQQCPEVDFICCGDGEPLLLDLLDNLETPENVKGLVFERDGKVVVNPFQAIQRDLDRWPIPDRQSLPMRFIESMPLDVPAVLSMKRYTTMQTSRGCPWPCVFCDIPIFNEGKWRDWSAEHVLDEFEELEQQGYEAVYFVDDHFLLRPKRIEAICNGIIERGIKITWGCEGRVDSVAQHLFPLMAKANCVSLMFGIESGSQKILDRLKKGQTKEQIMTAVAAAKKAGIEVVHGFFVVGSPDETIEDIQETFEFASTLRVDSFGFNRLCVYRGTPLWQEYLQRGIVNDVHDWYKYFKCSAIDPTCLPGDVIHAERSLGLRRLMIYKLTHYPIQSFKILRRFFRHMSYREMWLLLFKPFLGKKDGATPAETISRQIEHARDKDRAAELTQMHDGLVRRVAAAATAEREKYLAEASSGN